MATHQKNPCLACRVNQQCCSQLSGLRLSREEFEKYFQDHANELSIIKYRKTFIVSARNHQTCPHWRESGCAIYMDRPSDCRLYPYEITRVREKKDRIEVLFSDNPGCPLREDLLLPIEEAKSIIEGFCRDVYGERRKPFLIRRVENRKGVFQAFPFLGGVVAQLSRFFRAYKG